MQYRRFRALSLQSSLHLRSGRPESLLLLLARIGSLLLCRTQMLPLLANVRLCHFAMLLGAEPVTIATLPSSLWPDMMLKIELHMYS